MEETAKLPDWVNQAIESYESHLRRRKIVGFITPLYTLESRVETLSEEQRVVATEIIMQIGIEQLQEMKGDDRISSADYFFFSGNIAAYLQNIGYAFPNQKDHRTHICMNLALLVAETECPLANNMLSDTIEITKDWESYRELYD